MSLLATTALAQKSIAAHCGFTSAARLTRAFERTLGVAPSEYRSMTNGSRASA